MCLNPFMRREQNWAQRTCIQCKLKMHKGWTREIGQLWNYLLVKFNRILIPIPIYCSSFYICREIVWHSKIVYYLHGFVEIPNLNCILVNRKWLSGCVLFMSKSNLNRETVNMGHKIMTIDKWELKRMLHEMSSNASKIHKSTLNICVWNVSIKSIIYSGV